MNDSAAGANIASYDILLVEDDDAHAELFASRLSGNSDTLYRIQHAECLMKAQELVQHRDWDLIVLDLGLPESRGIETLERLTDNGALKLPIVVQTASEDIELGQKAIERGALDFMTKDFTNSHRIRSNLQFAIERQRQRSALEEAEQDLKSFAHCAAHDLKAPLRTISISMELMRKELKRVQVSEDAEEYMDLAQDCAKNAVNLVQDLLRFSEYGNKVLNKRTSDLTEVAHKAQGLLASNISGAGARLVVNPLPHLEFDPDLMLHVLQNLISNAIKFHGDEPPEVIVSSERSPTGYIISVADNGIGIEKDYAQRIFEPFKRLNKASGDPEGSGLGLSICKRIVEAHRGKIWVESTPGKGSVFKFSLPSA